MAPGTEIELGVIDPVVVALILSLAARTPLRRVRPTASPTTPSGGITAARTLGTRQARPMNRKG